MIEFLWNILHAFLGLLIAGAVLTVLVGIGAGVFYLLSAVIGLSEFLAFVVSGMLGLSIFIGALITIEDY